MKRQATDCKTILAKHVYDKEYLLVSIIYKELLKLKNKKKNNLTSKNGQKI